MTESYFVCATPRTGSSLLLGLLESTGLAGRPESYFRRPDEPAWAHPVGDPRPGRAGVRLPRLRAGRAGSGHDPQRRLRRQADVGDARRGGGQAGPGYGRRGPGSAAVGVTPHELTYEQLIADMPGATRGVLAFLGLDPGASRPIKPRHHRQADRLNDDWAARYRTEAAR